MLNYEVINGVVNRPILPGSEFNNLLPESSCEVEKTSYGNYCEVFNGVVFWAKKYVYKTRDLSKLLIRDDLKTTSLVIKDFLFQHIQYSYNDARNIKSPSCVWSVKQANCHGYSVFASTILSNLGIKHFIRFVAYSPTEGHAYILVLKDQRKRVVNNNFKHNKDYYTIDATIKEDYEPKFKVKIFDAFIDPDNLDAKTEKNYCDDSNKNMGILIGLSIFASILFLSKNKI